MGMRADEDEAGDEQDDGGAPVSRRRRTHLQPHRAGTVLTLGILGLVVCPLILGTIAWVMGSGDLKAMQAGRMDPSGESTTRTGMVLGIVGVCLGALGLILVLTGTVRSPLGR